MIKINRCENNILCKIYCYTRTILKALIGIILAIAVCFISVTAYKTIDPFDKGYETQDFLGYQLLTIGSNSMYPLINVGDGVMVKIINDSTDIEVGDIVAYRLGEHIIVHRVKDTLDGYNYITQGDNNNTDDGQPIPRSAIMAKYVTVLPKIDQKLQVVKTLPGKLLFIVFGVALWYFIDNLLRFPDIYFGYSSEEDDEDDDDDEN